MKRWYALLLCIVMTGCSTTGPLNTNSFNQSATRSERVEKCVPEGNAVTRTTMYFGLSKPSGKVSEREWQAFLNDQVTTRFPQGLTVWEADGQWRQSDGTISREHAKVLLLIHDGKATSLNALAEIVSGYRNTFEQESVLWESAQVCAAF